VLEPVCAGIFFPASGWNHNYVLLRYRIIACILAAFCVVSAGRGFVPKLCLEFGDLLTERAMAPDAAVDCDSMGAVRACCAPKPTKEDAPPAGKKSGKCPFCEMAKALVEVPEPFQIRMLPETPADTFAEPLRPRFCPLAERPRTRAPPAPLAPLA
jgi:hypothetical protein